ncbi:hypothetical protein M408DRAFT_28482 [Serendipita vermifera MAFF 305830]|uniref:Uncharacterized protein n=1 Tax=Serendipita vermifera MAFF 305830 TaxID=933852 RepID=A0A0C2W8I2_SERVB|nr:hypothetical protein M408DRAFT_28482 [Serendipita vermifera MAFF 305830]
MVSPLHLRFIKYHSCLPIRVPYRGKESDGHYPPDPSSRDPNRSSHAGGPYNSTDAFLRDVRDLNSHSRRDLFPLEQQSDLFSSNNVLQLRNSDEGVSPGRLYAGPTCRTLTKPLTVHLATTLMMIGQRPTQRTLV